MKRKILCVLLLVALVTLLLPTVKPHAKASAQNTSASDVRIMSANVLAEFASWAGGTAPDPTSERVKRLNTMLVENNPVAIGTQEMSPSWYTAFRQLDSNKWGWLVEADAAGYSYYDYVPYQGMALNSILYRKDILQLTACGVEAYNSRSNGQCIVWGAFTIAASGKQFVMISTHWTPGGDKTAERLSQAEQLADKVNSLRTTYGDTVICTGDFNCTDDSQEFRRFLVNSNSIDSRPSAASRGDHLSKIDHVTATADASFSYHTVLYEANNAYDISDHPFIIGDIKINTNTNFNIDPPLNSSLFFDYSNTSADRSRYGGASYGGYQFDRGNWATLETSTTSGSVFSDYSINNSAGTLSLKVATGMAYNSSTGLYGPFLTTAKTGGTYPPPANSAQHPLQYAPGSAEFVQIRFKLRDCSLATGSTGQVAVVYDYIDSSGIARWTFDMYGNFAINNDSYQTVTIPVSDLFRSAKKITTLGLRFCHIKGNSANAAVEIDYVFVGPAIALPTKHVLDHKVTAATCTAKGYTTHTCRTCGFQFHDTYTNALGHSYTGYCITAFPTMDSTGTVTGSCTRCSAKHNITMPKLNATDYLKVADVPATCTQGGTDKYYWYNTDYGIYVVDVSTSPLGHRYDTGSVTTKPTLTTTGIITYTCLNDSSHRYTELADALRKSMFFDFKNDTAAENRYKNYTYGYLNFDHAQELNWFYNKDVNVKDLAIDPSRSKLVLTAVGKLTPDTAYPCVYFDTAAGGNFISEPLYYDPDYAEYYQIRFSLENFACGQYTNSSGTVIGEAPYAIVQYCANGMSDMFTATAQYKIPIESLTSGQDIVITLPLNDAFRAQSYISKLRFFFGGMESISEEKPGVVKVDYIFVGPEAELPAPIYTVTFQNEDGTVLETTTVSQGETAVYTGAKPTMASTAECHFTFKGWDRALSNITADTTVTATYTAAVHSFTYTGVDTAEHKAVCSCGYSKNESHSYHYQHTPPTCAAQGYTPYTCSLCTYTYTDNYVNAEGHTDSAPVDNRCDDCGIRIKDAALRFRTISLEGNIAINYYMDLSDQVAADEKAYMLFTMENGEQTRVPATQGEHTLYQNRYYYVFTCEVTAKEMADIVLCQFFYEGGQTEEYSYSVKTYADNILASNPSEKLANLIRTMLNYGAASQIHFEYHMDRPANAGQKVPDYTQINIEGYPVNSKQGTTLATYAGASLLLTSETTLRIFFNVDSSIADRFTVSYRGEVLPLGIRSGKYYADIPNIGAKDLDEYFTLSIFDGTETAEVSYSPLSYCASIIENAKGLHDRELQDVAAAMYLYNQAANSYFAK